MSEGQVHPVAEEPLLSVKVQHRALTGTPAQLTAVDGVPARVGQEIVSLHANSQTHAERIDHRHVDERARYVGDQRDELALILGLAALRFEPPPQRDRIALQRDRVQAKVRTVDGVKGRRLLAVVLGFGVVAARAKVQVRRRARDSMYGDRRYCVMVALLSVDVSVKPGANGSM